MLSPTKKDQDSVNSLYLKIGDREYSYQDLLKYRNQPTDPFEVLYAELENSQMRIVTGPRIELAITLIDRIKGLFTSDLVVKHTKRISLDSKETVIELNGIHIEAYPSHHLDAMRGLKDVSFIYMDEGDFFPPGQQQDARDVSERYIAKSNDFLEVYLNYCNEPPFPTEYNLVLN